MQRRLKNRERVADRPLRRVYLGTMIRCRAHPDATDPPPPNCRVRARNFYCLGNRAYWVDGARRSARDTRADCLRKRLRATPSRSKNADAVIMDVDERDGDAQSPPPPPTLSPTAFTEPVEVVAHDACLAEPVDMFAAVVDPDPAAAADDARVPSAIDDPRAALTKGRWVCYVLQSTVRPRRTYVGATNDRFRRLRMHNGEITGGARRTRANRPWRMVAVVFGFRTKIEALQFEWSMHHPRARRLRRPHCGVPGRRNCLEQLVNGDTWRTRGLRVALLPMTHPVHALCLARLDADAVIDRAKSSLSSSP